MSESELEALRVRLKPVAKDGPAGAQNTGPLMEALARLGSGDSPQAPSGADGDVREAQEPSPQTTVVVDDEPDIDLRSAPTEPASGHAAPVAAMAPVEPGPSVRSLLTPRTRWDEEPAGEVVSIERSAAKPEPGGPEGSVPSPGRPTTTPRLAEAVEPEQPEVDAEAVSDPFDQSGPAPALPQPDEHDDFGPLELPQPRVSRARSIKLTKPKRRTLLIAGAAVAGLVGIAGAAQTLTTSGHDQASAPPTQATTPSPDVRMAAWRGMDLPVSDVAGPFVLGDTNVSGFAQTELGAAVAAAHLSVRLDPAAGPATFNTVLQDQVVGDVDRMAAAVQSQYRTEATPDQYASGQALPVTPGRLLGWRTEGDPSAGAVTAHLAVESPDTTRADYAVPLRWTDGDWAVEASSEGPFFPVGDVSGDYSAFEAGVAP